MAANLVLNVNESQLLEAPVHQIDVAVGTVVVTVGSNPRVVKADSSLDVGDVAGASIFSPTGARLSVIYTHDIPETPSEPETATRGDSGGSGGSYESRTVKELQKLAKERELRGYSGLTKDELIEALRDK